MCGKELDWLLRVRQGAGAAPVASREVSQGELKVISQSASPQRPDGRPVRDCSGPRDLQGGQRATSRDRGGDWGVDCGGGRGTVNFDAEIDSVYELNAVNGGGCLADKTPCIAQVLLYIIQHR